MINILIWGEHECCTNEAARKLHSDLVRWDGNIIVNNTKLQLEKMNKGKVELTDDQFQQFKKSCALLATEVVNLRAENETLRTALKRECCCPGERSDTTGKEILCDACETLASLTKDSSK